MGLFKQLECAIPEQLCLRVGLLQKSLKIKASSVRLKQRLKVLVSASTVIFRFLTFPGFFITTKNIFFLLLLYVRERQADSALSSVAQLIPLCITIFVRLHITS